ncbi:DUF536 domain-containing protein (plasmid) [Providencia rettgeri]|nr:hypothetical protein [Proteus vulgaris]QKG51187.1 DUF536 domain-containing protein [Proteus mirabilis]QNN35506.1 DUF536 domain-containing protein [Providencia rettgeri]
MPDKLIKVLEEQLEEANKSRANLEKLLDQQQQLTLISNRGLANISEILYAKQFWIEKFHVLYTLRHYQKRL